MTLQNLRGDVIARSAWHETVALGNALAAVEGTGEKWGSRAKINKKHMSRCTKDKVMGFNISTESVIMVDRTGREKAYLWAKP